jgi:hypothetical protein
MLQVALELELAAYFLGRVALAILFPWCQLEPPARRVWTEPRDWTWRGLSHRVAGERVIHTQAIEIAGVLVMVAFVALGSAVARHY